MDDYTLDRSRMLYSMEAALQPQLRPTFSDIGRSSIGTAVVDPTYQNRYFHGPLPLGGGAGLPFLGSMFTSSMPPTPHYRSPAANIVNMRQFWPPTPPPDAYSRCAMSGSLYPLYSSLTPSSESPSPYSSQPIMPHLATSSPYPHLMETHKDSPFLSPSLSLSSPLPPSHQLTNSAPYLSIPPSSILDRHPVYSSLPTLGIKGLELPVPKSGLIDEEQTTAKEAQECNKNTRRELQLERNCKSDENRSRRSRDGIKVAAVKGREKTEDTKPSPARYDSRKSCETTSSSSIPAVMTATVSPSVVHGSHRSRAIRSAHLEEGDKMAKSAVSNVLLKENVADSKVNTMHVHPVSTTVIATSTGTTTSVTYSNSSIDNAFKPSTPCTSVAVTSSCPTSPSCTSKPTNTTADSSDAGIHSPKIAGKETQAISTFSTWVHHQTSITTVTNTRKTCYTSEGDCCSLTKQMMPETEGSSQATEAVNLSMDKIQILPETPSKKDTSPARKNEHRSHEKKAKVSMETGISEQNKPAAAMKEGNPPCDLENVANSQTSVFKGAVVSKKVENVVYTESWSNHSAICMKDERSKKPECKFSKDCAPKTVETKLNVQSQAMNLSVGSKSVKMEQSENASNADAGCSHVYFDRFSEPGVESVSSSHSLSALSRLASSASNQMFSPSDASVPWSGKSMKPSSMVSSIQSETMRLSQTSKSPAQPTNNSSLVICAGASPSEPLPDKVKTSFDCGKSVELKRKSLCTSGNTLLAVHETSSTVLALTSSVGCAPAHNSIPVGIAVAQQRQEPTNSKRSNTSEAEYFPVACQPQVNTDSTKSGTNAIQTAELKLGVSQPSATSILVNQGTSISAAQWDSDTIIRAPLQNSWLAQTPVVTPTVWLGQGTYATSATASTQAVSGIPLESSHMPLPPVGYQLARDPLSGQIFLIPATNLELPVVDRSSLWSTFTPGTVQQLVTSTPHYQQGFQNTNDRDNLNNTEKHNQRSIKQEPCTLVAQVKEKIENPMENTTEVLEPKQEVKDIKPITTSVHPSVTSIAIQSGQPFTISGFATTATPTLSYYYESPTIVHLTQPTAATLQTEPGKRSQGTSPLNPVTPSPPPDPSLDQEEMESAKLETMPTITTTMAIQVDLDACTTSDENDFQERTVEVLDSANQTDAILSDTAKEESEDELPAPHMMKEESPTSPQEQETKHFVDNALEMLEESAPVLPTESKPVMDFIDHHGLDLLVDSIEEFASREQVKEECPIIEKQDCVTGNLKQENCETVKPSIEHHGGSDSETGSNPDLAIKTEHDADSYNCSLDTTCTDGLGLLCALAEQRFLEESQKSDQRCGEDKVCLDINQNYQVDRKEAKSKNFLLPKLPVAQPLASVYPVTSMCMDPAELEMRERLADLQRKYKQKQRELARLKPKKEDPDPKKSPGRTKKHFQVFSSNFGKNFAMFKMLGTASKTSATQDKNSFDEATRKDNLKSGNSVSPNKQKLQKKKNSHSIKCHVLTKQKVEKAVLSAQIENGFDVAKFAQQQRNFVKDKPASLHKRDSLESGTKHSDDLFCNEKKVLSGQSSSSDSDDDKLLIDLQRKNSCEKSSISSYKTNTEEICSHSNEKSPTKALDINDSSHKPATMCDNPLGILAECASFFTNGRHKRKASEDPDMHDKVQSSKKFKDTVKEGVTESKDVAVKQSATDSNAKPKKSKSTEKTKKRPSVDEDPWNRRRSERIFLHDAGVTLPSDLAFNSMEEMTSAQSKSDSDSNKTDYKTSKTYSKVDDSTKVKKVNSKKEFLSSSPKKTKNKESKKKKDKAVPDELSIALKHCRLSESSNGNIPPIQEDSSSSEGDVPLSQLAERSATTELRSCKLKPSDLHDNLRVLTREEGLYYAGYITAIQAPDIYGITLDGERCNRPRIFSREELLNEAILEVKPTNVNHIPLGKRVCAFWSQQYRCLYPGKVAKWKKSVGGPVQDSNMVFVEFDDGDSGRIPLEDIRLLPKDIPIQNLEPEPLLLLGKKRQRSTSESQIDQKPSEADVTKIKHKKSKKLCKSGSKEESKCSKKNSSMSKAKSSFKTNSKKNSKKSSKEISSSASSQSFDALSVFNDSASCTSFNSSCSSNKPNQKKKSKKSKSESKSKSKQREECSATDDSSSSGASVKSKKHKKHKTEHKHRHHHHRHHCHHSHHHKKRKHEKRQNSKSSSVSSPDSEALSTTVKGNDPVKTEVPENKKSELCVKIKSPSHKSVIDSDSLKVNCQAESKVSDSSATSTVNTDAVDNCEKKDTSKKDKSAKRPMKRKERTVSVEKSKIAAFLPARQLWGWSGKSFRRHATKGKAKKEFFRAITRGKESIKVGDCAVFLSTGRPHLPYVGRIETMWQSWGGNMVVKVKWFYHPEETKGGKKLADPKGALFQSPHVDENDVQTISHKCEVLTFGDYKKWRAENIDSTKYASLYDNDEVYYLAGTYEPLSGVVTLEPGVS